ncbi:photosystem II reaction center PsbP family protein [Candidatus Gracilibacteria bacterium]|nr:photosystem II reaction center PsbP family protein [Candidatus Gracilibacteria bacterium]MCF7856830.1 photosystem II reaction center PsbP family protein [Candidatus Gracilibacteria bacterium]MCF7897096.1 photosystem II reaction center PsbP family protein [Candidatus Gracilibacteria bacterium]
MKKLFCTLCLIFAPIVLFACGKDSVPPLIEDQVSFEKLTGVVRQLGTSIYQQGTHRLEKDGTLVALLEAAGPQIKLDSFVGQEVEVEGIISPTVEGNLEIMKVVALTPVGGSIEGKADIYEDYADTQFDFSIKYPKDLTAQQTRRGAAFFDSEEKIIEVVVLENTAKQELSDWLIDNYGYTADALRRVAVAGLSGYQFQNTTGSVIYLGYGDKVFTLAWYDNSETNRSRNRRYYLEIVQSFVVAGVQPNGSSLISDSSGLVAAKVGEFCGGIAAIQCGANLQCRLSGNYPDAGGICIAGEDSETPQAVTSDQIEANAELPEISAAELQRGWYYGDREQKKPSTPLTWILVDSGTRSAMWRRLDSAPAESAIKLPDANALPSQLSTSQQKVLNYLTENINSLSPEVAASGEWKLVQLAFADPNFVYAVFTAGSPAEEMQTRRLLFVYTVTEDEVAVELQSFFKPGEEKDWLVIEGADTAFGKAQTVVNTSGEIISNIAAGYRLFTDTGNGFQFQYPKDWYWRKTTAGKIEFSNQPFPAGLPILTAKIVAGVNFDFGTIIEGGAENSIFVEFDSTKSVQFSTPANFNEVLLVAAQTFELR